MPLPTTSIHPEWNLSGHNVHGLDPFGLGGKIGSGYESMSCWDLPATIIPSHILPLTAMELYVKLQRLLHAVRATLTRRVLIFGEVSVSFLLSLTHSAIVLFLCIYLRHF